MAEYLAASCPDYMKVGDVVLFNPARKLKRVSISQHENKFLPTGQDGDCRNLINRAMGKAPRFSDNEVDTKYNEHVNMTFQIAGDYRYPDVVVVEKYQGHRLARFMRFLHSLEFLTMEYKP